jgi:hypothetical protein
VGPGGYRPWPAGHRWLLTRRNRRTRELAFYRCYSPRRVPLPTLVKIAGTRWATEENFQAAKGLTGLDDHQVRRWGSWYRWTTLAMLALAFLTVAAATEHTRPPPAGQIPLTRNEIAGLLASLVIQTARDARHRLRWSTWRRRHQHRAKPATTSGKPGNREDHGRWLECQPAAVVRLPAGLAASGWTASL